MFKTSPNFIRALLVSALTIAFCFNGRAQEASRPERGLVPNGSFSVSDIENINLLNGNVNINIPLASLPPIAGGKLSWTVSAQYNSKVWDVARWQENDDPLVWAPYSVDAPGAESGWRIGSGYSILFRNANDDFQRMWHPDNSGIPAWDLNLINNFQWWKVVLRMPDGSEHELRPTDHSPYSGSRDFLRGFYNVIPNGSPMRYHSVDGTFIFARISSMGDWTVYTADGTQISLASGIQRIQDTNGNKIKVFSDANGTHYQDEQTNREIRITYDPAGQGQTQVWYKTVGGTEHHIDINWGTTTVQGKLYSVNKPACEYAGLTQALFSQIDVVREIVFPQTEPGVPGRKFTFSYNSDTSTPATDTAIFYCPGMGEPYTRTVSYGLGELSQIVLPSGSIIDYTYNYDGVHSFSPYGVGDYIAQDKITQKKLTHDGIIDTWTYDIGDSFGNVTGPDGSVSSESAYCSLPNTPGCASDKSGLTYRSTRPFTRVERHWITLMFSGANNQAPNGVIPFNPVVDKEYTTLTDAQGNSLKMSAKAFTFDYNGNVTQEIHYDWFDPGPVMRDSIGVPTGVPPGATVLRTINHSHYNQAATGASANVYAKRSVSTGAPLILNSLKDTTLGTSSVQFSYDGQAYGVAPTVGNLTSKAVWVDLDSRWITTSFTYGAYGNISTSTDGRGKVMQFFFDDSTHALPNRVVVDPQNGTGTQTTTTAYDVSTGLVTSQRDVNDQQSTIDYTNQLTGAADPFGRPGLTKSPVININGTNHQRRVTTTYLDSSRQVIVASDLNAENDKLLKTRTTTDMLGRPVLTEQTEDGSSYTISVKQAYLNMGRVTLTSSAMRSSASTTDSWTRATKDMGGRVTEVATFGGAAQPAWTGTTGIYTGSVTTAYEAHFTTVTDQAGKVRRSMIDSAGRLRRVDEPNSSGSLGSTTTPEQPTSYSYDVFGNLISVAQGSQTRTFTYDSLSRLRTAINPESGTITYQYDDNGNVLVKTEARGVSTHFEYDSINRVTRRWYNGSSSTSHTIHNDPQHPIPSGVGTTNEAKFYYDTQNLPPGAPTYTRGSAVGRLVAQTYGTSSNGDYYAYDVLGQQTLKIQQTGTINYQVSAAYSLSGAVTGMTYPSGYTVANVFDQAGRLTSFSGNLGDGINRTYTSSILYSPTGGLVQERFGTTTTIYNKLFYNSRGQLAEIRASTNDTVPTDADRGAIVNKYSNNCNGICSGFSMPDNNGNLLKQEIHIPSETMRWQQYDYDSLNRLNWAREVLDGGAEQWRQQFIYDPWGNRRIDNANTYGTGINNKAFNANPGNNRLEVPTGQSGTMEYDLAGNLTNDTYTGAGNRTYDGENKITSAWGGNNQAQLYGYDASGQRIKRTVDGVETWHVYGLGGELLAEYPANGPTAIPQKEYGYRNEQLLITATPFVSSDHSLSLNGSSAYVQVANSTSLNIAGPITLEAWIKLGSVGAYQEIITRESYGQSGTGGGYGLTVTNLGKPRMDLYHTPTTYTPVIGSTSMSTGVWYHVAGVWDGTYLRIYLNGVLDGSTTTGNGSGSGTSSVKIGRNSGGSYFNGLIDEVRASNAAVYTSNFTPQMHLSATSSTKGLWKFDGRSVADASANGNNGSLQGSATYSTDVPTGPAYHSLSLNGSSGYVQVANSSSLNIAGPITLEAWIKLGSVGAYQEIITRESYAQSGTGGGYGLTVTNLGKPRMDLYHTPTTYTPVIGSTSMSTGVWYHVAGVWDGTYLRIYLNGVLDGTTVTGNGPGSGTSSVKIGRNSGSSYFNGLIDEVRASNAAVYTSNFTPQMHLSATSSTKGLWKFDGQSVADASANGNNGSLQGGATYSGDVPSGDGGGGSGGSSVSQVQWLIADHLGTPRMIFDTTGDLENMKRHDYMPFGEELFAPTGGRTTAMGYGGGDGVRQQFTQKERDVETGLDYFGARYYASTQGRFTSVDPENTGAALWHPQSWNGYTYALNNPLRFIDPDGLRWAQIAVDGGIAYIWFDDNDKDDNGQTEYDRALANGYAAVTFDESKQFSYTNGIFAPGEVLTTVTLDPRGPGSSSVSQHTVGFLQWLLVVQALYNYDYQDPRQNYAGLGFAFDQILSSIVGRETTGSATLPAVPSAAAGVKLTPSELKKLGGLSNRAEEKVADVIRSRGGNASNVREAGPWAQKTLAETAKAATGGDKTAETAIKIAKQAGRLGQKN